MHSLPRRYWPGVAGCRPLLAAGPRVLYINASQHSACLFQGAAAASHFSFRRCRMARKATAAKAKSNTPELTKDEELYAFREMLLIRRFEEKAGQMYGMGLIGGFCHLYIGQEAVVTGITMASKKGEDAQITGYRDHGHMLVMGLDPNGVMAELTGRQGGLSRGKGGSMHMFSNEHKFYGGNGIVGAQVSLGAGLAFAAKYRGEDRKSVTYFGDGAANQGQVYEAFNMAKLWSRSEEHTSELQSRPHLVCRLL